MKTRSVLLIAFCLFLAAAFVTSDPALARRYGHHGYGYGYGGYGGYGYGPAYGPAYYGPSCGYDYYPAPYYGPVAYPPVYGGGGFYYNHGHHGSSWGIGVPGFSFNYH